MTHLASMLFDDLPGGIGMWMFLSIGAVSLFVVFIPTVHFLDSRRKEREAFYKAEDPAPDYRVHGRGRQGRHGVAARRSPPRSDQDARRAEDWRPHLHRRGCGLVIFLRVLLGPGGVRTGGAGSAYLCGLIPGFIGVAMLIYVFFMAGPIE